MGIKDRVGRCYELAFRAMSRGGWPVLCHGYIHYQGACVHHAWVEGDGEAYDAVMDYRVTIDAYRRMFDAQDVIRYTAKDAMKLALESEIYGPWVEVDMSRMKLLSSSTPTRGEKHHGGISEEPSTVEGGRKGRVAQL